MSFIISTGTPSGQCAYLFFPPSDHVCRSGAKRNIKDARGLVMRQSVLAAKHNSRALVQRKQTQCVHKIMSQTRIDSLRIMLRLPLFLINADNLFAAARILAKTIVRDAVKPG